MGNIVVLDDLTINKIAAGEVIERPASVVKELVENSIDAGADNISIEIKNGGISYIRITDNGKGIMPDDIELAFERHATSKIRQADDLEVVTSMGFRGEALASIASISHVEVISKTIGNEIGCKVEVQGGNIVNKEDVGCPQGTTMTVTDLFYNTPVRYKFLKKDFTEAGYIEDVITRIALVHPEISIKLVSSGKTVLQTSGNGDRQAVIYNVYGKDIAENIIDVDYDYEDIKIVGVIGKPAIARSNRTNQLFFVNDRYVKDRIFSSATEQAYKGLLTIGKHAFVVLNIKMNPRKVDVNVHPAKLEVRFEDENQIFKGIFHSIKDSLLKVDLVPGNVIEEDNQVIEENEKKDKQVNEEQTNVDVNINENSVIQDNQINNENIEKKEKEKMGGLFSRFSSLKKNGEQTERVDYSNFIEQLYNRKNNYNLETENKDEESSEEIENINKDTEEIENENIDLEEKINKILQERREKKIQEITDEKTDENIDEKVDEKIDENVEQPEEDIKEQNSETKVLNLKEVNEKMEELANLQIEDDYENFEEMYAKTFGTFRKNEPPKEEEKEENKIYSNELNTVENISIFGDSEKDGIPPYKLIGIVFSTYIIIEINNEMYIIDQHAAHERIMYEKIKANYYSDTDKDSQLMLLPDIINLSRRDMQIAKDNMEVFEKAGFVLDEFGENTIKLSGVPNVCIDLDTKELFLETLDEINTVARTAKQEIEEKFIATVACKAAVKANMALTKEEVDNLMSQLLLLQNPFTCPHGRPTAIKMTKTDIEKKFSRR